MMIRLLFAALSLLALPAASPAADYGALLAEAIEQITWEYPENLAFTETRHSGESTLVSRYDPRRDDGERWSLVSVDGREPSSEEIDEFLEKRRERRGFILGDDEDGPGSIVGDESLELIEESDAHWLLGFVPTADDDKEDRFLRKLRGTLRIAKDGGYLEYLDISATEPVSPAMGVKIRDFNTRFEFAPVAGDGPVLPVAFRTRVKGRAFLAMSFDESEAVEFSDFENVHE
ncbi:MAG: hypothetical protein V2I25_09465 [Woeseiaceae bacterium]|jgi:hypothetical protein|nr:hypothetical protein [Woeseiaceae bacterium]